MDIVYTVDDECMLFALSPTRVVVIAAGVSTFIWCKRDIDQRRLAEMKEEQRKRKMRRPLTIGNAGRHS